MKHDLMFDVSDCILASLFGRTLVSPQVGMTDIREGYIKATSREEQKTIALGK